jgi:hypothetical protein
MGTNVGFKFHTSPNLSFKSSLTNFWVCCVLLWLQLLLLVLLLAFVTHFLWHTKKC